MTLNEEAWLIAERMVGDATALRLAVQTVGEPFAGTVCEDLLLDPGVSVHSDVARLCGEDDCGLAFER